MRISATALYGGRMKTRMKDPHDPSRAVLLRLSTISDGGNVHYAQCLPHKWADALPEVAQGCPYRRVDWARLIKAANDTINTLAPKVTYAADVEQAFRAQNPQLNYDETEAALSLTTDPIEVNQGNIISNGRHRVCAMRAQGVKIVPGKLT